MSLSNDFMDIALNESYYGISAVNEFKSDMARDVATKRATDLGSHSHTSGKRYQEGFKEGKKALEKPVTNMKEKKERDAKNNVATAKANISNREYEKDRKELKDEISKVAKNN